LIASAGYVQFQSIVNIGPILKAVHATGSYPFVGMTVHDFAPKLFPEFVPSEMPTWFEQEYLPSIEREADDVFCVSEQTARDAIQYLSQARPFKIWTLPLPIQIAAAAEPVEELLRVHGLVRDQFILFVGSFEPRKNFFALLDGYETYLRANPQSSMNLVVVGSSGWKNESELARLNSSPVATQIVRLGYLSDSHLVEITRAARAVAMLSHYEGYGLPLAQAVSLGTRCLTTLGSSLPEACAGLGYFVNPADPYSVAVGIKQIEQSKFRPTVPKLAEQRTWDNYVRSILEVIRVRLADRS
jgi:glycosyltransferase involved in cell wall biosynthesis